ncbi:MAG TPA: sortase [Clostridiaceae bacterium]|nr:sortase [Clostridiaceae bacterium]
MDKIRPNPLFNKDNEKVSEQTDENNIHAVNSLNSKNLSDLQNNSKPSNSSNSSKTAKPQEKPDSSKIAAQQDKSEPAKATKFSSKNKKKRKKPIIIVLDILIIACLVGAAYFFLEPKLRSKRQLKVEQSAVAEVEAALESIAVDDTEDLNVENEQDTPSVSIKVNPNANKVPGEGYEDFGRGERIEVEDPILDENGNVVINFIGTLRIPKIELTTPIADNDSLIALRYGAGHTPDSAKIGEPGRALIFGHWFNEYGRVFNRLNEIEVGDEFTIDLLETKTRYYYKVHQMLEIEDYQLYEYLFEKEPEVDNEVVLVSCKVENNMWWSSTGRYLACGELIKTEYLGPQKKNPVKQFIN